MTAAWTVLAAAVVLTVLCAVPFVKICGKYGKNEKADWFFPGDAEPEAVSAYAYDGTELKGILLGAENSKGTVILLHGWHSSWQKDFGGMIGSLRSLGFDLLLCGERAHGASRAALTTLGIRERRDAASWVTATQQLFGEAHPIFLFGSDMGAAAAMMASDGELGEGVRGIIAESGYSDARDAVTGRSGRAPGLTLLLTELYALGIGRFGFAEKTAAEAVKKSHIPMLMIHGEADTVIPLDKARALFDECAGEKRFLTVSGAEHGECCEKGGEKVIKAIEEFLNANV